MVCVAPDANARPPEAVTALADAFSDEGWTPRVMVVVERHPGAAPHPSGGVGAIVVPASSDQPDLRSWPTERLADPSGWLDAAGPDDLGLWAAPWTGPVRAAIAAEVTARRPELLYVSTPVWSVADAVREVATDAGIPFVVEPVAVRPPGLRRGLGTALGPVTEVEAEVVAAAAAVLVPDAAVEEWADQHPHAHVVAAPLSANEAPAGPDSTDPLTAGPITVLGGVPGSAPLGELIDAWQLAGAPGTELLWWGDEPMDRSQRALLDQAAPFGVRRAAAGEQDAAALARASLVVALIGDRQGLPRGATTAQAAGTPMLLVAEPGHRALGAAASLRGTVAVPAHADLIAQVLAAPPSRGPADHAGVAAEVAAAWRGVVRALLVEVGA